MIPVKEILVKNRRNYTYVLSENAGENFHINFKPEDVIFDSPQLENIIDIPH